MRTMNLSPNCDICGNKKSEGSHQACAKIRQKNYEDLRKAQAEKTKKVKVA